MSPARDPRRGAVAFDVLGTLFDLAPARTALVGLGAPPAALEAWFGRILHEAATVTILGRYTPFTELAGAALRTTLAQLELDPQRTEPLAALDQLEPYPEAAEALARLCESGCTVVTLTNGAQEATERLLDRGGLRAHVAHVISCDAVKAFKPHPAPYAYALERVQLPTTLVAAHGWDVVGARAAGLAAIWIDRTERVWPFPFDDPRQAGSLTEAAALILEGTA